VLFIALQMLFLVNSIPASLFVLFPGRQPLLKLSSSNNRANLHTHAHLLLLYLIVISRVVIHQLHSTVSSYI